METAYWYERWDSNQIGFHLAEVNPYLERFWSRLNIAAGSRVLAPLSGKSLDLLWLSKQGYEVVGVELSPLAVKNFFAENHLSPVMREGYPFDIWEAGGIALFCGDFFALTPEILGPVAAVYDRAALVALPPELRQRYASHLASLCPSPIPRLLISLEYDQSLMQGPPFSVTEEEVRALFGQGFQIEKLMAQDVLGDNERFRAKGLTALDEAVYMLT